MAATQSPQQLRDKHTQTTTLKMCLGILAVTLVYHWRMRSYMCCRKAATILNFRARELTTLRPRLNLGISQS